MKKLFALVLVPVVTACSHPLEITGGGDIWSASGDRTCFLEDFQNEKNNCVLNYVENDYYETYYAAPRAGWRFDHWDNYCKNASNNECRFDVPASTVQQFQGETAPPLRAVFTETDSPEGITCTFTDFPPLTDHQTWDNPAVSVKWGISSTFAGISTNFDLINSENSADSFNILQQGSGASMQTTWGGSLNGHKIGVDQGVGFGPSWGAAGTFDGMHQIDWTPLWSGSIAGNPTSPCGDGTPSQPSMLVFNGKQTINGTTLSSGNGAIQINRHYSYTNARPIDYVWSKYLLEQAMYLSFDTAKNNKLRVFIGGRDQSRVEGPIIPTEVFSIENVTHCGTENLWEDGAIQTGCWTKPIEYVVFVYEIGGKDIGIAISRPGKKLFKGFLGMTRFDPIEQPDLKGVDWHSYHRAPDLDGTNILRMKAGDTFSESLDYTIGTLVQLNSLGFSTTPKAKGPPTTVKYENTKFGSAASSSELCPATAAIDGNLGTSYCSYPQVSSSNQTADLKVWFPSAQAARPINRVYLQSRMYAGQPIAFPKTYQIIMTSSDNITWVPVPGVFDKQPNSVGQVVINLPVTYWTRGIWIVPVELRQDEFSKYVFQLSELGLGYEADVSF
jgi:hypothetical protein